MAKRTPHMTSKDAICNFKSKISESLPLLGFLNNEDKIEVWRFWKTVSSAVKIAVNGKGDIVETPRRNHTTAKLVKERQLVDYHLQPLDKDAITIYAPVKCFEKGFKKFRVLKIANQKKISDCYETIPILEGEDSDVLPNTELGIVGLSVISNSDLVESKIENDLIHSMITNSIANDEELKAVATFFKDSQAEVSSQESDNSFQSSENYCSSSKVDKVKPIRKIWPVSRPTTRSLGARVIKDRICENEESKLIIKKSECDSVDVSSITFYPNVKEEVSETVDDDFNITIVPVGNSVMQISQTTKSGLSEELHSSHGIMSSSQISNTIDCEESLFHQNISSETAVSDYDMQVILSHPNSQRSDNDKHGFISKEAAIKEEGDSLQSETQPISLYGSSVDLHKNEHNNVTPRSSSDIETIISALEEELKKTGSSMVAKPNLKCNKTVEENGAPDVQGHFDETPVQTVHILEGEEIVEVQHVGNVFWTNDGEVQIIGTTQVDSTCTSEGTIVYEGQPVEAQYDVVEYEILADKKLKRGRKKKSKDETDCTKSEVVDRTCPICHRVLNYASSMTAHMRIHTGVRPYSCGQCDRRFTTKANRDRHEATHVGLKPFQCTQCSKSFTEKRSLKIHMRTHTGERPFVCNVCGRGFTQKCTLLVHMDRHTNKKGHLCDLCGKAFRQKCQLDVHVKRHKRQASFPCNECSTKCYTKGDLMRHMIKHTGERPYRCQLCNRAFTRKQYLIDHENQHYGRKPYRCSVCSATFHDMGSCHRHLRKHKQDEEGENSKGPTKSALLSSTDFHRILEGTQIGQILKLDDGTDALVKAVTSEADGSTVYHITCLGKSPSTSLSGNKESFDEVLPEDGAAETTDHDLNRLR